MYSMKLVAQKTGLSQHVIRAWEKRYQAIVPVRTDTNRRLYSDDDIERLKLLAQATSAGYTISNVAHLPTPKLVELVNEAPRVGQYHAEAMEVYEDSVKPRAAVDHCVKAVEALDGDTLESVLHRASVTFSQPVFLEQVLVPLVHQVGDLWEQEVFGIAQEHLASSVIRTVLGTMLDTFKVSSSDRSLIATTVSGQMHELGALIVAIVAAARGWRAIYLGPNLPAGEIAFAAQQHDAKLVTLSLVYPFGSAEAEQELRKLRCCLPKDTEIVIGGKAANSYEKTIQAIGATMISELAQLRVYLDAAHQ